MSAAAASAAVESLEEETCMDKGWAVYFYGAKKGLAKWREAMGVKKLKVLTKKQKEAKKQKAAAAAVAGKKKGKLAVSKKGKAKVEKAQNAFKTAKQNLQSARKATESVEKKSVAAKVKAFEAKLLAKAKAKVDKKLSKATAKVNAALAKAQAAKKAASPGAAPKLAAKKAAAPAAKAAAIKKAASSRTPLEQASQLVNLRPRTKAEETEDTRIVRENTATHKWQFFSEFNDWRDYAKAASRTVEENYVWWLRDSSVSVRRVQSGHFHYMVDFNTLKQQNVDHAAHTVRAIRRVTLDKASPSKE